MRKLSRGILAGGIAAAAFVAAASPAAAKCGHGSGVPCPDPVGIEATIYDPSWKSIVIEGRDAWRMLNVTGVNYRPFRIYDAPPVELGPAYQVIYRITSGGRTWTVYQDLYPHAAGRPFAYTRAGQRFMGRHEEAVEGGHGWRGSRTLEWILEAHGLPEDPPIGSVPAGGQAVASGGGDGSGPPPWGRFAAGAVLVSLGGLAAIGAFRPPFRRRSVRARG